MHGNYRFPQPGQYRDQLGRVMIDQGSTDGAWQIAQPKSWTGQYAKQVVAHRTKEGSAHYDGVLDGKAMRELIAIADKEGLIVRDAKGKATNIDRFLAELRPYQLDICKEGADQLRALMAQAGVRREFFEISSSWNSGTWSDARANRQLTDRLLGQVPSRPDVGQVTPEIVGEGQDGGVTAFRAGLGPESQS